MKMEDFEDRLMRLIDEAVQADLTNEEIISAMELRIAALEEEDED